MDPIKQLIAAKLIERVGLIERDAPFYAMSYG
jgi:hypothetical protein